MSEIQTYTPSNGAMLVCSSGGDYIKTKDHLATIARLEAEIADLRAEVEQLKKELRILYSSNADMFASVEQAEKELAKYKAFWEYSREADKLTWLHYHWEKK